MIIGITSDIHDRIDNLELALKKGEELGVAEWIFCGDFNAPFAALAFANSGKPVHAIFGNNDGDRFLISKKTSEFNRFKLYGEFIGDLDSQLIIDGIKIGVTHYPFYAKTMIKTGWYDCVFYGHDHVAHKQKFGNHLLLNPGEIAGIFNQPSFAIFDTQLKSSEIILINS